MKRTQVNFAVDVAAFVSFALLLSTGLVLRYQLPPGSGGLHGSGRGSGAASREVVTLWDLTRHPWGDIHYWVAVLLVAVLSLHLILHWKWIVSVVRGAHQGASGLRFGLGATSLVALVALACAPLFAPTSQTTRGQLQSESAAINSSGVQSNADQIRGSMTVQELLEATGITAEELRLSLNLDDAPENGERVGRLLRQSGRSMDDLRQALEVTEQAEGKETEP